MGNRIVFVVFILACIGSSPPKVEEGVRRNCYTFSSPHPKNIVLLIGDGMGLSQISGSMYSQGKKTVFEYFPVIGFQKTHSFDNLITDSAASATAMSCGVKTFNNAIGVDADTIPCKTILETADEKGWATGLVATSSIVHATPAAFIAHVPSRNHYEQIALDFLETDIDFFVGGGKQFFNRRDMDKRNLIEELIAKDYYVNDYFNGDILKITPPVDKNFAFFMADNQPLPASQGRDFLPYVTKMALNFLQHDSEKGFFLMVEGSQIDWANHANQGNYLLAEMLDFEKTIEQVMRFARLNGETLVIVTADHETGGLAVNPGSKLKNPNIVYTTNGHTATMVPVFAYGPMSEIFGGIYDNTAIYSKMMSAFGFQ